MMRITFAVVAVCVWAPAALAEQGSAAGPVGPRSTSGSSTRERPANMPAALVPQDMSPAMMRQGGGSLLQAGRYTAAPAAGGGSLLGATGRSDDATKAAVRAFSPFAVPEPEPKLIKKHDLVTIIIREESEASSQSSSDLKRTSTVDATAEQMVRFDLANKALVNSISPGGVAPSVKLNGTRTFKGEGTSDRTDSFITRIQAEVLDVKPNGTLVLQARKKIKTDEEELTFVCAGICRVEDLTPDNTVLSTQLFDLEVSKQTKGQVRNSTKTGIFHKLLDFLNLF